MKAGLIIPLLILFNKAIGQKEFSWYPNQYNNEFDSKEIRDSSYSRVSIYFHYSDHLGDANWRDTLFEATFNNQGKITYQKSNNFYDSTINWFFYFNNGQVQRKVKRYYCIVSPKNSSIDTLEYDSSGKILRYVKAKMGGKVEYQRLTTYEYNSSGRLLSEKTTSGETIATVEYFYDKKGKKQKGLYISGKNKTTLWYKYDKNDSLIQIKTIDSNNNKTDSIMQSYEYDSRGNLIRESRYPSPTYVKTFRMECTSGEFFDNVYKYDSIGRKIYKAGVFEKQRIAHTFIDHTITGYNDFGYIEESFDSKWKKYHTSIYNSYTSGVWGKRCVIETYNLSSKITTFLSADSKLILSVDVSENESIGNSKFLYMYSK